MNKWIDVQERLPEGGIEVLCSRLHYGEKRYYDIGKLRENGRFSCEIFENNIPKMEVTHWMPLPEHPKLLTPQGEKNPFGEYINGKKV
jgi:hypothetical protein